MRYDNVLPQDTIFTWEDIGHFRKGQYLLMHSVIYRTQLLIDCGLELPKHTFYVDNLFVYVPLKHVKNLYYINVDFYRYFIGRQDQSVNERVMIKRIDQQIKVFVFQAHRKRKKHFTRANTGLHHFSVTRSRSLTDSCASATPSSRMIMLNIRQGLISST